MTPPQQKYIAQTWTDGPLGAECLDQPLSEPEAAAMAAGQALRATFEKPWPTWCYRRTKLIASGLFLAGGEAALEVRRAVTQSQTSLKAYKVVFLTNLLRRHKPRLMYEFGAGGSTFWMAALLARQSRATGHTARLVSFEQDADYYRRVSEAMPVALRPFVEIVYSPVSVVGIAGYRALTYDALPLDQAVDFAYIDGPAPISQGLAGAPPPAFSGDLVRLLDAGVKVGAAATDARLFNRAFFDAAGGGRLAIRPAPMFRSLLIDIAGGGGKA